jgi:lysozyme family protein
MIDRFHDAVDDVLKHEGGFVNHPADPGGATNWGVSLRFLLSERPELFAGIALDQDRDGDVDAEDVRDMPRETAIEIYRRCWWDRYGYHRLAVGVGEKVFDMSVNMGPGQAHRILQQSINDCGGTVAVDGALGPLTVAAANAIDAQRLLSRIRVRQAGFYRALVDQNARLSVFLRGWLNRAAA